MCLQSEEHFYVGRRVQINADTVNIVLKPRLVTSETVDNGLV